MTRAEEFNALLAENPSLTSGDLAGRMGISIGYVRKLAQASNTVLRRPSRKGIQALPGQSEESRRERERVERQAEQIVNYWAARGYSVEAVVKAKPFCEKARCCPCELTTDLVGGLPKDFRTSRVDRLRMRRAG